jgi:hypothetical protein
MSSSESYACAFAFVVCRRLSYVLLPTVHIGELGSRAKTDHSILEKTELRAEMFF